MNDFDFGNGPVPARQHPRGGGWVAATATVHPTAYLHASAQVFGQAIVHELAELSAGARVYDEAIIHQRAVIHGTVRDHGEVGLRAVIGAKVMISGQVLVGEDAQLFGPLSLTGSLEVAPQSKFTAGTRTIIKERL